MGIEPEKPINDIDPYTGITLSTEQLDSLIEKAATRGAHNALIEMGLIDSDIASDFRTLRGLARALKTMRNTFMQTLVRWLTIGVLVLLFTGVSGKLGSFIHPN